MWQKAKNYFHFIMALMAGFYFHFPSREIKVIAVTGTDGKTTTVHMINEILTKCGYKTSYISSLHAAIGSKIYKTGLHVTTPSAWQIQKFLRKAVNARHQFFILEATSHGLDQHRLSFINFEIGVLTNITHEHLDYHKTWENYALAKLKLLKNSKIKIINVDDESFKFISNRLSPTFTSYGFDKNANINLQNFPVKLKIKGTFNLYNALAAAAVSQRIGISKSKIIKILKNFEAIEGRMQKLDIGQNFKVYIDFAHTPNALEKALAALKEEKLSKTRIITVFGAAGDRDKTKRPLMGEVASRKADIIILTSEDQRSEPLDQIITDIKKGIKGKTLNKNLFVIHDRAKAIEFAISLAQKNDIVVIFGKGHEKSMTIKSSEIPWNEYEITKKAIIRRVNAKVK